MYKTLLGKEHETRAVGSRVVRAMPMQHLQLATVVSRAIIYDLQQGNDGSPQSMSEGVARVLCYIKTSI